jgi:hypothetical protein
MKLSPDKFFVDESLSNPMVVAYKHKDCPADKVCFRMVVGFGTIQEQCEHLKDLGKEDVETASCDYPWDADVQARAQEFIDDIKDGTIKKRTLP